MEQARIEINVYIYIFIYICTCEERINISHMSLVDHAIQDQLYLPFPHELISTLVFDTIFKFSRENVGMAPRTVWITDQKSDYDR